MHDSLKISLQIDVWRKKKKLQFSELQKVEAKARNSSFVFT